LRDLGRAGGSRDAHPFIWWRARDCLGKEVSCRKVCLVFARDRRGKAQPTFACLGRIEADEDILERH
jgi:hypothetical protein